MLKTEVPGIYKKSEGVLVNADNEALMKYRKKRELRISNENRINSMEDKVDKLSNDMEEIKSLLIKLTKE
jgi:hypothetical protein